MDRQRRLVYDYAGHYRSPPPREYYYEHVHPVTSAHGDSSEGYRSQMQNSSGYIGYQHTNTRTVGSHNYRFRYPEETCRLRDRSPRQE